MKARVDICLSVHAGRARSTTSIPSIQCFAWTCRPSSSRSCFDGWVWWQSPIAPKCFHDSATLRFLPSCCSRSPAWTHTFHLRILKGPYPFNVVLFGFSSITFNKIYIIFLPHSYQLSAFSIYLIFLSFWQLNSSLERGIVVGINIGKKRKK